jgi:hypothetical protein
MARKPSVTVQMADEASELPTFEEILGVPAPQTSPPAPQPAPPEEDPTPAVPTPGNEPYPGYPDKDPPAKPQPPAAVRYESRIVIVDAWRYPGSLKLAPDWIDRNWAAFADTYDIVRKIDPGPALRVPTVHGSDALCRIGDYVAKQTVKLSADIEEERIEVWEAEQFMRLFLPVGEAAPPEPVEDPPLAA